MLPTRSSTLLLREIHVSERMCISLESSKYRSRSLPAIMARFSSHDDGELSCSRGESFIWNFIGKVCWHPYATRVPVRSDRAAARPRDLRDHRRRLVFGGARRDFSADVEDSSEALPPADRSGSDLSDGYPDGSFDANSPRESGRRVLRNTEE